MSNTIADAIRPLLWLQDALVMSVLWVAICYLSNTIYQEWRGNKGFKVFGGDNINLLLLIFVLLFLFISIFLEQF